MRIVHGDAILGWMALRTGEVYPDSKGIGVMGSDNRVKAAAAFERYNGQNILVHIFIEDPWATRALFRGIGLYAFRQLGCRRLTLLTDSSNVRAVKLFQDLGGVLEGCLEGASKAGTDILVFRLTLETCVVRRLADVEGRRFTPTS